MVCFDSFKYIMAVDREFIFSQNVLNKLFYMCFNYSFRNEIFIINKRLIGDL